MDKLWNEANSAVSAPLRKVPGQVKPLGQLDHETKTFRESIQKMKISELKDLLTRQENILSNSKLVSKLPDKGEKVKMKRKEILDIIEKRNKNADEAADLMKDLKIDTEAMEWKYGGNMFKHLNNNIKEEKKEETEKENVFRTLASKEVPDKETQEYALEMAEKFDAKPGPNDLKNAPFQQLKRKELDEKSKTKIPLKRQENRDGIRTRKVEVMPLPPNNYERISVQQIDLKESMELQKIQMEKMKEAQLKSAIARLANSDEIVKFNIEGTSESKMAYRESDSESDENENQIEVTKEEQELDSDDDESSDDQA